LQLRSFTKHCHKSLAKDGKKSERQTHLDLTCRVLARAIIDDYNHAKYCGSSVQYIDQQPSF